MTEDKRNGKGDQQAARSERSETGDEEAAIPTETLRSAGDILGLALTADEAEKAEKSIREARRAILNRRESFRPSRSLWPALGYRPFEAPAQRAADPLRILPQRALQEDSDPPETPEDNLELLFAPLSEQLELLFRGAVKPRRLVDAAIARLEEIEPALKIIVTDRFSRARRKARALTSVPERNRGSLLWGLPYGAKDLFDTKDLVTSFGAEPYRDRQPSEDAAVVARCREAGAVLTAKLSLGELAMGDQWYGGRTNNPWKPEQGAGGSSAGSAAAVAAGGVSFALGTETSGSIITPSMRCGVVGLRPTFGRVARTGAMPLSWSFDKIGPLTRTPRDAALVFAALAGADPGDPDSVANSFPSHADIGILNAEHPHVRIGHMPRWFHGDGDSAEAASPRKRDLLQYCEKRPEFSLHEITLPDLPYRDLSYLLLADAAAVFEDLTLSDQDDLLSKQDPDGWPNIFRGAHFLSAVEYLQLQRFRRHCLCVFEETLEAVDVIMAPAYADQGNLLVLTTATGHPSITLPIGFTADGLPDSITLFGKPYSEATLVRAAELIMEEFNLDNRRPALP